MTRSEFEALKPGDKIQFTNQPNRHGPERADQIVTVRARVDTIHLALEEFPSNPFHYGNRWNFDRFVVLQAVPW